jgi:hypothetical protein
VGWANWIPVQLRKFQNSTNLVVQKRFYQSRNVSNRFLDS